MVNYPPSEPVRKHKAHDGSGQCISFSFDGKKIVTGGGDGMVKLWDSEHHTDTKYVNLGRGSVSCVSMSQNGKYIAAGDPKNQIALIDVGKSLTQKFKLQGHKDNINACKFGSNEKNQLVSVSSDRTIRIWDVTTGRQSKSFGVPNAPFAVDVALSDTVFASGHKTGDIKLWSLSEYKES